MKQTQHTIQFPFTLSGTGLHTGQHAIVSFLPAESNTGIRFQRTDLPGQPVIAADADLVIGTSRGTSLGKGEATIHTVEHVLAAISGLEIDNLLIRTDGPEIPILDGSSQLYVASLRKAGLQDQGVQRDFFEIPEAFTFRDEISDGYITIEPHFELQVSVKIDFASPVLGTQEAVLDSIEQFGDEIAPCRTFCFLHEVEQLHASGKIKGGDLSNAVVIADRAVGKDELTYLARLLGKASLEPQEAGILNHLKLKFPNEPARHKLLDVIGDLALVGHPVKGKITAFKPGHRANIAFAQQLKKILSEIVSEKA